MHDPILRLSASQQLPIAHFEKEEQMKLHFAKNLHLIEPGLTLYEEDGITGTEVPCRVTNWGRQGSIDILAVDERETIVVIECKMNYGDAAAFGQVLGYMAWIRSRLISLGRSPEEINVRGIIIAKRANPILRLVMKELSTSNITVFEYEDALNLTKVG